MTEQAHKTQGASAEKDDKKQRLESALRANLRRRKVKKQPTAKAGETS